MSDLVIFNDKQQFKRNKSVLNNIFNTYSSDEFSMTVSETKISNQDKVDSNLQQAPPSQDGEKFVYRRMHAIRENPLPQMEGSEESNIVIDTISSSSSDG